MTRSTFAALALASGGTLAVIIGQSDIAMIMWGITAAWALIVMIRRPPGQPSRFLEDEDARREREQVNEFERYLQEKGRGRHG